MIKSKNLVSLDLAISTMRAFEIATSKDITRSELTAIHCQRFTKKTDFGNIGTVIDANCFRLISCDGRILLKKEIDQVFWSLIRLSLLREFGSSIPETIREGAFFFSKKSRGEYGRSIFEEISNLSGWKVPDFDKVIPSEFPSLPEERPTFSFEIYERVRKIMSALGIRSLYFYPKWNSKLTAAVSELGGGFLLLAMPCRVYEGDFT